MDGAQNRRALSFRTWFSLVIIRYFRFEYLSSFGGGLDSDLAY